MQTPIDLTASERLVQELTIATDASIGIIAIRCAETEVYRVVDELYALAQSARVEFQMHTAELGWSRFAKIDPEDRRATPFDPLNPQTSDKQTAETLKAFQKLSEEGTPEDGFFVMLDTYFTFGIQVTQTCIRKQSQRALANGQRLFLIVPNHAEIPDGIAPLMHVIHFGYPTRDELSQSLDEILESIDKRERPVLTDEERNTIISNGQGMTTHGFETAVALSITDYGARNEIEEADGDNQIIRKGTLVGYGAANIVAMIRQYKVQLLRKTNVLELQPNVDENDIGGLDLFKNWMKQRKATYSPEAKEFNITPSRGALVVGPPGTGKSLVAKAAGSILGLPVIRFDVGRVFGSYIGQSEQSMRTVLAMLDAMAPVVLMLDEIDKGFSGMAGGGGHDSGTTARVFGTFLTWMQERDQVNRPVFLIMTANRVEGLPPELLRKGRVDEIWSVNQPNAAERGQIIGIHARKRNQKLDKADMPSLTRITEGLVGAEIEALIEDALVMSFAGGNPVINYDSLEKAKEFLKPMSLTRATEFEHMKAWAEKNARPASSPDDMSIAPLPRPSGPKARPVRKIARVQRG
jgi:ATP-dependent 26S proteasome regulatory subunit